jgi:hypothetical protein
MAIHVDGQLYRVDEGEDQLCQVKIGAQCRLAVRADLALDDADDEVA